MSDQVRCDHCQKFGARRRFRFAPEGWLYLEAPFPSDDSIIVWACSLECGKALWRPARKKGGFKIKAKSDDELKMCSVVRAPTMEAAMALWLPGPGPRIDGLPETK